VKAGLDSTGGRGYGRRWRPALSRLVHSKTFVVLATAAAVLGALAVSPALGGPHFLTLGRAKQVFITKQAARRRFLTRAAGDARFLDQGEGDARYLQPQGPIRVSAGPSDWVLGRVLDGTVTTGEFADSVKLTSGAATASAAAILTPELPSAVYGRQTSLSGVELCYNASASARITDVDLGLVTETAGASEPIPSLTDVVNDNATRTDGACRTYSPPQPVAIGPSDHVVLSLILDYPTSSPSSVFLGRTTFLLQP